MSRIEESKHIYLIYSISRSNEYNYYITLDIQNKSIRFKYEDMDIRRGDDEDFVIRVYETPLQPMKTCTFKLTPMTKVHFYSDQVILGNKDFFTFNLKFNRSNNETYSLPPEFIKLSAKETFDYYVSYLKKHELQKTIKLDYLIEKAINFVKSNPFDFYVAVYRQTATKPELLHKLLENFELTAYFPAKHFDLGKADSLINAKFKKHNDLKKLSNYSFKTEQQINRFTMFFNFYYNKEAFIQTMEKEQFQPLITLILKVIEENHEYFRVLDQTDIINIWTLMQSLNITRKRDFEKVLNCANNYKTINRVIQTQKKKINELIHKDPESQDVPFVIDYKPIKADEEEFDDFMKVYNSSLKNGFEINTDCLDLFIQLFKRVSAVKKIKEIKQFCLKLLKSNNNIDKDENMDRIRFADETINFCLINLINKKQITNDLLIESIKQGKGTWIKDNMSMFLCALILETLTPNNKEDLKQIVRSNCKKDFGFQGIINLLNKIHSMKELDIFLELLPQKEEIHPTIIESLIEKYTSLFSKEINTMEHNELIAIAKHLMDVLIVNHKEFDREQRMFNYFKDNAPIEFSIELFTALILQFYSDAKSINHLFEYIFSNTNKESYYNIIKSFNNNAKLLNYLFDEQLKNYSITEPDFFAMDNPTSNWMLFEKLVEGDYFSKKELAKTNYNHLTRNTAELIKILLTSKIFNYNDYQIIVKAKPVDLKKRLKLICLFDIKKADKLIKIVDDLISLYNSPISAIPNVKVYIENFVSYEIDNLKLITSLETQLNSQKLNVVLENIEGLKLVDKYNKDASSYNQLIQSKIWGTICKANPIKSKTNFNENQLKYVKLCRLFDSKGYLQITNEEYKSLLKDISKRDEVVHEIEILKKYYNHTLNEYEHEKIINVLFTLSQKRQYFRFIKYVMEYIDGIKAKPTTKLYNKLKELKEKIIKNRYDYDLLQSVNGLLMQYNIDIQKPQNSINVILELLSRRTGMVSFLLSKTNESLEYFNEVIDEGNDFSNLKKEDIDQLKSVMKFIVEITRQGVLNDEEMLKRLHSTLLDYPNKELALHLNSVILKYEELFAISVQAINKEEFFKNKIIQLSDRSEFNIEINSQGVYEATIRYGNYLNKTIKYDEVLGIKDRSMFLKNKYDKDKDKDKDKGDTPLNNMTDDNFDVYIRNFHVFIDKIILMIDYLNELISKGYPKQLGYLVQVIKQKNVTIDNESIDVKIELIEKELEDLRKTQNESYETNEFLPFVFGRQFQSFTNYFFDSVGFKSSIIQFFNYITDSKITEFNNPRRLSIDTINNKTLLTEIGKYIESTLKQNNISIENIYQKNIISKGNYSGVYKLLIGEKEIPEKVSSWYINLCMNMPLAHTVLLCNENTTSEEITAYMYRVIKCQFNVLFFIIRADILNFEKREIILVLLKQWSTGKRKAALVVTYFDKSSYLINQLDTEKCCCDATGFDIKSITSLHKECPNIEIIDSDISGVGKSRKIKEDAMKNYECSYVYFPLGGNFVRQEVINRLKKEIESKSKKIVLHIDLSDSTKDTTMKDFLFLLLFTKCYYENENILYLPNSIEVKVEIPFGFINYFQKYIIFALFKRTTITKANLPPLIVDQNPNCNTQIVVNYLKSIDTLSKSEVQLKKYSQQECQDCIFSIIKEENKNYYFITSYINALSSQLQYLTNNLYLSVQQLTEIGNAKLQFSLPKIREFIVNSFNKITQYFTKGAYNQIIQSQKNVYSCQTFNFDDKQAQIQAISQLAEKGNVDIIKFKDIDPSLVFFNEDQMSLSIITTIPYNTIDSGKQAEYLSLKEVWNSGVTQRDKEQPLKDYTTLSPIDYLEEVKRIFDKKENDILNDKQDKNGNVKKSLKSIVGDYVFTSDNFIKMILILLRVRANVPVILMGETGCGKTSLIKKISDLLDNQMQTLNIHAGISDEDIIGFMQKIVIPNVKKTKTFWVFLDEINTCESLGLISEMMCKHTMQGQQLPEEIVFVSACNPYKIGNKEKVEVGLDDKSGGDPQEINLVYKVNPLPHSLLNFVFNFGSLEPDDELKYINSIIRSPIQKTFKKANQKVENNKKLEEILAKTSKAIFFSQDYIRKNNGNASVSLREIRRFEIFYLWFYDYLSKKKIAQTKVKEEDDEEDEDNFDYSQLDFETLVIEAIFLSIYICYYLRITDTKHKGEFQTELFNIFDRNFLAVSEREENEIINKIELPKGIAKNKALLQNVFCLFVCVNTKVALFICGKPGCSKSLSVQLLFNAMRGANSLNAFFHSYPAIYMSSYQGSLASTSKGVLNVFEKARKLIRIKKEEMKDCDNKIISMIYFDEMGLAEKSVNNPLKVIHSQLEYDDQENKVAFVGISNWTLDASKMNRGVFLAIHDPDEEDLIKTAETIAGSFDGRLIQNYKSLLNNLASTYARYKVNLAKNNIKQKEFHGTRDFYHLIKIVSNKLVKVLNNQERKRPEILGIESIERNFGGLENSIKEMKILYNEKFNSVQAMEQYKVMTCITENIREENSRYLLVVSKSSLSPHLINNIIERDIKRKNVFYIGSQFEQDSAEEYYGVKILNKIQTCMALGYILVLKNLQLIYASLYDLFNQNFQAIGGKNYARIAVGSTDNSVAEVHRDFFCIILLDKEELSKQDPPFLNRFEKHIVEFDILLNPKMITEADNVVKMLDDLGVHPKKNQKIELDLRKQFINSDISEIEGILYQEIKNEEDKKAEGEIKELEPQQIFQLVLKKIVPTFSQDLIAFSTSSIFKTKYSASLNNIYEQYKQSEHRSIMRLLKNMTNMKNIIYTFSNILDTVLLGSDIQIKSNLIGNLQKHNIYENFISKVKSETELEKIIKNFYKSNEYKVNVIKFLLTDIIHLNHFKFLLENYERDNNVQVKPVIIIVYLPRRFVPKQSGKKDKQQAEPFDIMSHLNIHLISHLSSYNQLFIDNINGSDLLITDLINLPNNELFNMKSLIDPIACLNDALYTAYMKIKYTVVGEIGDYILTQVKKLTEMKEVNTALAECIIKNTANEVNVIESIFTKNVIKAEDVDFISIIKQQLRLLFEDYLDRLIFKCEKDNALYMITAKHSNSNSNPNLIEIWKQYLNGIDLKQIKISTSIDKPNEVKLIKGLKHPLSKSIYDAIMVGKETLKMNFYNNEYYLRTGGNDETPETLIDDYKAKEEKYVMSLCSDFSNNQWIQQILEKYEGKETLDETITFLTDDFYKKFIVENLEVDNPIIEEILQLMISKRFGENDLNKLKQLAKIILWVEANKDLIKMILELFIDFLDLKPNLFELLRETLNSNVIQYEISSRSPEYKRKVNEVFVLIIDNLMMLTLEDINFLLTLQEDQLCRYIDLIQQIVENCSRLEFELQFISKEKTFVSFVLDFQTAIRSLNNYTFEHVIQLIEIDKKERFVNDNHETQLKVILIEEYNFIVSLLKDSPKSSNLIISYLTGKYKKYNYKNYRNQILAIMLSNDEIIKKSYTLLQLFFSNFVVVPEYFTDNNENTEDFLALANADNEAIALIEKTKNVVLIEILLFFFETKIHNYFAQLKKQKDFETNPYYMLLNSNLLYLKKSIKYLDDCVLNNQTAKHKTIGLLYAISYVKVYSFHYITLVEQKGYDFLRNSEILEALNMKEDKTKIRKMIKIYMLKLIRKGINVYDDFIKKIKQKLQFSNEFALEEKVKSVFDFTFISLEQLVKFMNCHRDFSACFSNNFKEEIIHQDDNIITKYGVSLFYDVTVNQILSNVLLQNYQNQNEYKQFYDWMNRLLNNIQLNNDTLNLMKLFLDKATFEARIYPVISKLKADEVEIIFYCFKFCLMCSQAKENSFYRLFTSNQCLEILKNSFIPGREPNENRLINSCQEIEGFLLEKNHPSEAAYICSCNTWYSLQPCGLPGFKKGQTLPKCINCNKEISGYHHVLTPREGHYRVYLNEEQRKEVEKRFYYKPLAYKMLADLKKEVEILINKEHKGITTVSKDFFFRRNKNIRELNQISYRILNMLIYSILYFNSFLDYVNEADLKAGKILVEGLTCFDIIKHNWKILKEELKGKQLFYIQVYLNQIYFQTEELIKNSNDFTQPEQRKKFESDFTKIINDNVTNFQKNLKQYMQENNKLMNINPTSMKSIVDEKEKPSSFPFDQYPYMEYFQLENYPDSCLIEKEIALIPNYKLKYPTLFNYFDKEESIQLLQNFVLMNPFSNYMINRYSYQIVRNEAKKKTLKNEIKDEHAQQLLAKFIQGWNNIKSTLVKYQCRPEMSPKELSSNDCISYALNDDGEIFYGMYLATAFQNFIKYQNTFLKGIVDIAQLNGISHYFVNSIKKEMMIQDATQKEIVSFDIKSIDYNSFEDIIAAHSTRDCFGPNKEIIYENYQNITYNIDKIEEELGKVLLSGKRLYSEKQRFVVYNYEGYNAEKSALIEEFNKKYKQTPLEKNQKQSLINHLNTQANQVNKTIINFLFSTQLLVSYLQNENENSATSITQVVNSLPKVIKLNEEYSSFFKSPGNDHFTIGNLIEINDYVEKLSYPFIVENVDDAFKEEISPEEALNIVEYFNTIRKDKIITKELMTDAARIFVSRFISGKRFDRTINMKGKLTDFLLAKEELWAKEVFEMNDFGDECIAIPINVLVNQSVTFANLLLGDSIPKFIQPIPKIQEKIDPIQKPIEEKPIVNVVNPPQLQLTAEEHLLPRKNKPKRPHI